MRSSEAHGDNLRLSQLSKPLLRCSQSSSFRLHGHDPAVKIIPLQHPSETTSSSSSSSSAVSSVLAKWKTKVERMTWTEWIETLLPCYRWIRTYKWREYLQVDLMAGLTVGIMPVPQSMSYAKLAGLQPIYGLYSGFVPIFVMLYLDRLASLLLAQLHWFPFWHQMS